MSSVFVSESAGPRWREVRRARILDAALGLFRAQAPESVSTEDIARAAGIGKATLYRYFETKEALVRACLEGVLSRLNERLETAEASPLAPPERLRRIIGAMVDTFSDDLMPLGLITRRESELRQEWRASVHDARRRLVAVLGAHFRRGMSAGWYRDFDGDLVAHFVMGMIRSGVTHVDGVSRAGLAAAIHDFVVRACQPGSGAQEADRPVAPAGRRNGDHLPGETDVHR